MITLRHSALMATSLVALMAAGAASAQTIEKTVKVAPGDSVGSGDVVVVIE